MYSRRILRDRGSCSCDTLGARSPGLRNVPHDGGRLACIQYPLHFVDDIFQLSASAVGLEVGDTRYTEAEVVDVRSFGSDVVDVRSLGSRIWHV